MDLLATRRESRSARQAIEGVGRTVGFFDLTSDPLEQSDLAASDKPEHRAARDRLRKALESLPPDKKLPFARPKEAG